MALNRKIFNNSFDCDKLKEECGVFGVLGLNDAANFVALGLHALQHRGQEAGGIVAYDPSQGSILLEDLVMFGITLPHNP